MDIYLILCCIIAATNGFELRFNSTRLAATSLSQQDRWRSNKEANERNVQGVIAGTDNGLVVIPLNSLPQTFNVTSKNVFGLSFDWNSRKMYWVEQGAGIMRANVDGSGFQMLLVDPNSFGLAIEPITGNVYYGSRSRQAIRVCNNDANRCSTIAHNGDIANVEDIAFHVSQGFLFWSIYRASSQIVRANFDGTNATVILERPAVVLGLGVDENADRLYWTDHQKYEIGSCGLNGQQISMLPNVQTSASDVEIDGEKVYFTNFWDKSVYSTTKQGLNSTLVVNLPEKARRIALFGRGHSISPKPNPCEFNECEHLCVLTSVSTYRCLCPDGEEFLEDVLACKI